MLCENSIFPIERRKLKAQSLVEFALVLPLLLLLILAAMDIGRMFYTKMVLTNAAREGANYLAYYPNTELEEGFPGTYAAIVNEGDSSNVEIIIAEDVSILNCCTVGSQVGVSVTKTVDLVLGNVLQALGLIAGPITLTGTVWMVVQ